MSSAKKSLSNKKEVVQSSSLAADQLENEHVSTILSFDFSQIAQS